MRKRALIHWGLLAVLLLAGGIWLTTQTNRRDRMREEVILGLQAQRIARHVNARKPQYEAYLHRVLNSERDFLRVLLYDLSGWELGRARFTRPPIPLNESAVRHAAPKLLRPLSGETPLPPHEINSSEWHEARLANRLFATNVLQSAWISEMPTTAGDTWLVATAPVHDFDPEVGRSFVSAWVQAAIPIREVDRAARDRWLLLLAASGATALLFGGVAWTSTRQDRTLRAMASFAETIPFDRLATTRLPEPRDEPDAERLAQACNRLLKRVADAGAAQQRFVADAAHELRTPLTILRGEIQVALREPRNHPFVLETLRSNLDEAVRLSRLVESLLILARCDVGQSLDRREPVVLAPLLRASLARLEPVAAQCRVSIEFGVGEGAEEAQVLGDDVALTRIVQNLVENAFKHSPAGEVVRVNLALVAPTERLVLTVADRGIGIAPEHLPRIFDRFYRVDTARRRAEGGAGLGLAIVRTLVEAQGGVVTVKSEIGEGSTFTVELPVHRGRA